MHPRLGSVTPEPQGGNPRPRIFRIREARAVINRCGCNSHGAQVISERVESYRKKHPLQTPSTAPSGGVLGVNIAKNKTSTDAIADYLAACKALAPSADYLVLNVSSPNTPGLRNLQARAELAKMVKAIKNTLRSIAPGTPLLVKVAPDLSDLDKKDIASVAREEGVDGLIVSNTTIQRPSVVSKLPGGQEKGGLSGRPVRDMSTNLIREMYALTEGKIPIVGCGGVSSGVDAYEKVKAGASLVQLYTSFTYEGPALVPRIKRELEVLLRSDGFQSISEAVGVESKKD